MSWEEELHRVVRKYYRGGREEAPGWIAAGEVIGDPTVVSNASCGDRVTVYRRPGGGAWLEVAGCAVCKASASVANRLLAERPLDEVCTIARRVLDGIAGVGETSSHDIDTELAGLVGDELAADVRSFFSLSAVPGRRRCAELPWEAVLREADVAR